MRTLSPDPIAESARYYAKTGIYPINHTVIMRRSLIDADLLPSNGRATLASDLFPYGVATNYHTLQTALAYSTEQGLTPRDVTIEDLTVPNVLDT